MFVFFFACEFVVVYIWFLGQRHVHSIPDSLCIRDSLSCGYEDKFDLVMNLVEPH